MLQTSGDRDSKVLRTKPEGNCSTFYILASFWCATKDMSFNRFLFIFYIYENIFAANLDFCKSFFFWTEILDKNGRSSLKVEGPFDSLELKIE